MTLSILHFKSVPRGALFLLAVGLLAWLSAAGYVAFLNPEIRDFTQGAAIKRAWAQKLAQERGFKFVIAGGSSSSFSIDGHYALEAHNLALANLALGAGMGAKVLTRFALMETKPGDTLILMLEPTLLYEKGEVPQLGQQFGIVTGEPALAHPSANIPAPGRVTPGMYLSALRPGGQHAITLLAKLFTRRELYRYKVGDFRPTGQKTTQIRVPLSFPGAPGPLSEQGRALLANLRKWCNANNVRLLYALPWAFCPTSQVRAFREANLEFLLELSEFMPVLADEQLGAYDRVEHFADTAWHLNEEGARLRTRILAEALLAGRTWSRSDLEALLRSARNAPRL